MSSALNDQDKPGEEVHSSEKAESSEVLEKTNENSSRFDQLEENKEAPHEKDQFEDQSIENKLKAEDSHSSNSLEEQTPDGYSQGSPMHMVPPEEIRSNSIQGDFISESVLYLNNEKHEVNQFNHNYRCLKLSGNQLLFTGPNIENESCFLYDLDSRKSEVFKARLNNPRTLHAMSEINGKIAVIGGHDSSGALSSVEVLLDYCFLPIQPLNRARYGHAATTHQNITWVVGGASSKGSPENSIEFYSNNSWQILEISPSLDRVGAGLVSYNNKLIILGGFTSQKVETSSVFMFDPAYPEIQFSKCEDLAFPCCFSLNLWNPEGSKLSSHSFLGKPVEYMPS